MTLKAIMYSHHRQSQAASRQRDIERSLQGHQISKTIGMNIKTILSVVALVFAMAFIVTSICSGFGAAWGIPLAFTGLPLLASAIGIQAVASSIYLVIGTILGLLGLWGIYHQHRLNAAKRVDNSIEMTSLYTRSPAATQAAEPQGERKRDWASSPAQRQLGAPLVASRNSPELQGHSDAAHATSRDSQVPLRQQEGPSVASSIAQEPQIAGLEADAKAADLGDDGYGARVAKELLEETRQRGEQLSKELEQVKAEIAGKAYEKEAAEIWKTTLDPIIFKQLGKIPEEPWAVVWNYISWNVRPDLYANEKAFDHIPDYFPGMKEEVLQKKMEFLATDITFTEAFNRYLHLTTQGLTELENRKKELERRLGIQA